MARSSLIPGFRFHPTDEELVMYYLKRKLLRKKIMVNAIAEINIYDFSPEDLPDKSLLRSGDLEWYFFCPKAKKYSVGCRSNRSTETGFWKATGKDRTVKYKGRPVASIKTLVFHRGHAGKGQRTDWVMHEYKMEDEHLANAGVFQDMYVLCKVFEKSGSGPKNGAQYGAPFNEEEWEHDDVDLSGCFVSQVVADQVGASNRVTEPGASTVTFSANKSTNTLNCKQMGPAAMNMVALQSTHGLSVTEPGSCSFTLPANVDVMPSANDDVMPSTNDDVMASANNDAICIEDLDLLLGTEDVEGGNVKAVVADEDQDIFDDLVNLIDLDELREIDFETDGTEFTLDGLLAAADLQADLGAFFVD